MSTQVAKRNFAQPGDGGEDARSIHVLTPEDRPYALPPLGRQCSQTSIHSSLLSSVVSGDDVEVACSAEAARRAAQQDGESRRQPDTDKESKESRTRFVRPLVFGGVDGLSTTLTLVWGAAALGSVVADETLLSLGVANLLAKGCSMGMGDYFGTQAENRVAGIVENTSCRSGLIMFASFVVFGGVPLLALLPTEEHQRDRRALLCAACAVSLFLLGLVKARFTSTRAIRSGIVMVSAGGATAFTSYIVGHLVYHLLGVPD